MRSFIAIPLKHEISLRLAETQKLLREKINYGISWADPSNAHITLKFLGEIDELSIPLLNENLKKITREVQEFNIICGGLGFFPNIRQPRVVWLGVQQDTRLIFLQKMIDDTLSDLGFPRDEKRFSPHLTLGRIKQSLTSSELTMLENQKKAESLKPLNSMSVNQIVLYKSQLSQKGPEYTKISIFKLG